MGDSVHQYNITLPEKINKAASSPEQYTVCRGIITLFDIYHCNKQIGIGFNNSRQAIDF
jgi:hypothetical protein